jgi:hypothetical protein
MATGVRPGGRKRTPRALANFINEGVPDHMVKAPSPAELEVMPSDHVAVARQRITPAPLEDNEAPAAVAPSPPAAPVTPAYRAPETDPWEILKRNLPPEAIAALEQVTGKPAAGAGNAPWYECWDVSEGRPTGHPPFQGFVKPGQHVFCPFVDPLLGTCGRKTVKPLENYVPA